MKDIAERAGVSVETVYGQGSKASLLLAAVDQVRAGDADSARVADRTDMRSVLEAVSPHDALQQLRTLIIASLPAALPVLSAFRRAAGSDPKITTAYEHYERRRWTDLRPIADTLAPRLRPGVNADEAADVIWSLLDPTAAEGLVHRRGWSVEQWATWVTTALERLLLRDDHEDREDRVGQTKG
jgi:AcrR family transcriptional regulator